MVEYTKGMLGGTEKQSTQSWLYSEESTSKISVICSEDALEATPGRCIKRRKMECVGVEGYDNRNL